MLTAGSCSPLTHQTPCVSQTWEYQCLAVMCLKPCSSQIALQNGPKWPQNCPTMAPKLPHNGPTMAPKRPQDGPKTAPKWPQNGPKMPPKCPQNAPKMAPKWPQNGPRYRSCHLRGKKSLRPLEKSRFCAQGPFRILEMAHLVIFKGWFHNVPPHLQHR